MRQRILLADDSPTIRRLVMQIFADAEFEVIAVSNGDAAIHTFDEVHPSVVLADIYMPGKNGYEVCSYVRQHPTLGRTPVVLLVGAFDAFDEETAKKAGASANITKPFEPGTLTDLVTSVLLAESPKPADKAPPEAADDADLLGLAAIFKDDAAEAVHGRTGSISEEEIDRIADRVIQKLTAQVIENMAWRILPEIAEKIVREELKRTDES